MFRKAVVILQVKSRAKKYRRPFGLVKTIQLNASRFFICVHANSSRGKGFTLMVGIESRVADSSVKRVSNSADCPAGLVEINILFSSSLPICFSEYGWLF